MQLCIRKKEETWQHQKSTFAPLFDFISRLFANQWLFVLICVFELSIVFLERRKICSVSSLVRMQYITFSFVSRCANNYGQEKLSFASLSSFLSVLINTCTNKWVSVFLLIHRSMYYTNFRAFGKENLISTFKASLSFSGLGKNLANHFFLSSIIYHEWILWRCYHRY